MSAVVRARVLVCGARDNRRLMTIVAGLSLIPTLSGCIFSTERPDLSLDLPPFYLAFRGDVHAAVPGLDWWRAFRSPELTRFIEEAQTANFDIGAAIGRIMQADAQSKIANAPLIPEIDADSIFSRSKPSLQVGSGSSPGGSVVTGGIERADYKVFLNASYEIDFWGKNRAAARSAEETAISTRFAKEVVVISTIVSVANAYLQVLTAQDRLRIARQNLAAATRILTLIQQRAAQGTASALDVAQQESLVATIRANIPLFDQTLRQNIAVLAALVGRAPADLKVKGGSLYQLAIPRVTPGLPSELLFQRPDIRVAEANLASAEASVESGARGVFPHYFANRPGRLRGHRISPVIHAADCVLQLRRQHHAASGRRLQAGGKPADCARPQFRAAQDLLPDHPQQLSRRRERAHCNHRRGRAGAPAERGSDQLAARL